MMDLHCHVDLYPDHSEILSDIEILVITCFL